eukprot:scaffold13550_cov129-Isochrysis_galbana.AAC.2
MRQERRRVLHRSSAVLDNVMGMGTESTGSYHRSLLCAGGVATATCGGGGSAGEGEPAVAVDHCAGRLGVFRERAEQRLGLDARVLAQRRLLVQGAADEASGERDDTEGGGVVVPNDDVDQHGEHLVHHPDDG